jgi:hypothetical protein
LGERREGVRDAEEGVEIAPGLEVGGALGYELYMLECTLLKKG